MQAPSPPPRLEQGLARAAAADAQAWRLEHEASIALIERAEELEATALATSSELMPQTTAPASRKSSCASRNEHASAVQPEVSSLG